PQALQDVGYGLRAAEELGSMLELKSVQAAEGRALFPNGRGFAGSGCGIRQLALYKLVKMRLQQAFKIARRIESVEGGDEGAFGLVVEPAVDKLIELFLLLQSFE